jgi:hypothetical protein
MRAFAVGWPIAACVAFVAIPVARVLTQRLVSLIDGTP